MVEQDLKKLLRIWSQGLIHYTSFEDLFRRRAEGEPLLIGKALEANFFNPQNDAEARIKKYIDQYHEQLTTKLEVALFAQKKRLADAERALTVKETKKALEDKRIATNKIDWHVKKLTALKSTELKSGDSRIFPFWYAPVFIFEDGKYVIKPMRYHCRPNGKPASYDKRYDGLYNARRDNLEGFWKGLFGKHHGFFVANSFYENVALNDFEKRALRPDEKPSNVVLHFNPTPPEPMILACLWDRWQSPGEQDLLSFTAITDEPPAEVAAAGHDRCVIPLQVTNIPAWMNPSDKSAAELYSLLDDRERPYYEHQLAA
jgi:putative SOS response-associated peptidase YedK